MKRSVLFASVVLLALGCTKRGEDYSVTGLMKKLEQGDAAARFDAVAGLKGHGVEAKPALPLLTTALKDADRNVRVEAIYAVAAIGPEAEGVLPQLIQTLKAPDADVRLAGTYAVAIVGLRSNTAYPALKALLGDRDPRVRAEAASGIRKMQLAARFKDAPSTAAVTTNK